MSTGTTILLVCLAYLVVVAAIGAAAWRRTGTDAEDYFLGGRTARTVVLFMALFGTNVTPFVLMGIPGLAYHHVVGVFGLNAAIVASSPRNLAAKARVAPKSGPITATSTGVGALKFMMRLTMSPGSKENCASGNLSWNSVRNASWNPARSIGASARSAT